MVRVMYGEVAESGLRRPVATRVVGLICSIRGSNPFLSAIGVIIEVECWLRRAGRDGLRHLS